MDNFPVAGLGIIRAADDDVVSSKTSPKSTRTKSYILHWNAGNLDLLSNKNRFFFLSRDPYFLRNCWTLARNIWNISSTRQT